MEWQFYGRHTELAQLQIPDSDTAGVLATAAEFYAMFGLPGPYPASLSELAESLTTLMRGGLVVLGSIHADMVALLEDRNAPLFNRLTDQIELGHFDIASILEILRVHADVAPDRLLLMWNLFEGVPEFYRDCFEQGVIDADRRRHFCPAIAHQRRQSCVAPAIAFVPLWHRWC